MLVFISRKYEIEQENMKIKLKIKEPRRRESKSLKMEARNVTLQVFFLQKWCDSFFPSSFDFFFLSLSPFCKNENMMFIYPLKVYPKNSI